MTFFSFFVILFLKNFLKKGGIIVITYLLSLTALFLLTYDLLSIAGNCMLINRAGEKWWKGIIPFYNDYTLFKIYWNKCYFPYYLLSYIIYTIASYQKPSLFVNIIYFVFMAIALAFSIISLDKIRIAYGKGQWYTIGLAVLYPIFSIYLAARCELQLPIKEDI